MNNELLKLYELCDLEYLEYAKCYFKDAFDRKHIGMYQKEIVEAVDRQELNLDTAFEKYTHHDEFFKVYAEFTIEKQKKLLEWLIQNANLQVGKSKFDDSFRMTIENYAIEHKNFNTCLCSIAVEFLKQFSNENTKENIRQILR